MTTPHGGNPERPDTSSRQARHPAGDIGGTDRRADAGADASVGSRVLTRVVPRRRGRLRRLLTWVGVTAVLLVVAVLGYAAFEYYTLNSNLQRSDILGKIRSGQPASEGLASDTNILIMGLDSRLDLRGNPLPQEMYDAMHTGDSSIGGMNANVLMVLHIPAGGGQATVIQIPRDDFVEYAGCYGSRCDGKIKEAYDHAFTAKKGELAGRSDSSAEAKHLQARDAGRAAQILTVEKFLGNGIRFDHWVEVTMVAFYQIALEVQPITVCLKNDTRDAKSGADFKAGRQQINAEQAVQFVRQRRDELTQAGTFTDLDRERRQQAFIASLIYQLKQRDTFANPMRLNGLVDVATKNVAVDDNLNILEFAGQAKQLSEGNVIFYTLPVEGFFDDRYGGNSNKVDVPRIQATVKKLLDPDGHASSFPAPTTSPTGPKPTVTVVNASGVPGAAARVLSGLVAAGYARGGDPGTAAAPDPTTVVEYPADEGGPAAELALLLGGNVTTVESADVSPGTVRVTIGTGYQVPPSLAVTPPPGQPSGQAPATTAASPSPAVTPLAPRTVGAGGPDEDTSATTLTAMAGGSIPCVK